MMYAEGFIVFCFAMVIAFSWFMKFVYRYFQRCFGWHWLITGDPLHNLAELHTTQHHHRAVHNPAAKVCWLGCVQFAQTAM